jgi:hypothetical protein
MPQALFMTVMSTGSSCPGRLLQMRQVAKSPSAVPASPPTTMVTPSPPCRFCTRAVPGAMAYWISMTELTGTTFQDLFEKCDGKLRPAENGSVAVIAICRMLSSIGMPRASMVAPLR